MAAALREVLIEPGLARSMAEPCATAAPASAWPAVADRYRDVAEPSSRSTDARRSHDRPHGVRSSISFG